METSTTTPPAGAIRHPRCGTWWTGTRAAHCTACCRTFSGTSAFDEHWKHSEPGQACQHPEQAGLVPVPKPYGVLWSWPGQHEWTG